MDEDPAGRGARTDRARAARVEHPSRNTEGCEPAARRDARRQRAAGDRSLLHPRDRFRRAGRPDADPASCRRAPAGGGPPARRARRSASSSSSPSSPTSSSSTIPERALRSTARRVRLWTPPPEGISVPPAFSHAARPGTVAGYGMTQPTRRRRVLIVEDEPALRLSYERAFRPRYDLIFASTGAEALEQLGAATPGRRGARHAASGHRRRRAAPPHPAGSSPSSR